MSRDAPDCLLKHALHAMHANARITYPFITKELFVPGQGDAEHSSYHCNAMQCIGMKKTCFPNGINTLGFRKGYGTWDKGMSADM